MPDPVFIRPAVVQSFIDRGYISYRSGDYSLFWFGAVHTFNQGGRHCMESFWQNLLRGNLPIPQERVIRAWVGESTHISYLLKRTTLWKRVVVGDGKGNYWLHIPEEVLLELSGDGTFHAA